MQISLLPKPNMPASKSLLDPPKQPIAIRPECIATAPTTLLIKQDISWSRGDFTAKTPDGSTILASTGKIGSNSARKEFKDASGLPLFTLRRSWFSFSQAWWLELPGGHRILSVRYRWALGQVKLDVTLRNAASAGQEEVTLKVRGVDVNNFSTNVICDERKVALVRKRFDRFIPALSLSPEYEVEVAEGMDTALVGFFYQWLAEDLGKWGNC